MRRNPLLNRGNAVIVIVLFILASFIPNITGLQVESPYQIDTVVADVCEVKEDVLVTCNTFGFPGEPSQEITMSLDEAEFLYDKIKELQIEVARDPLSDKTQQLQHEIITLADEHNLLPAGLSVKTLKSRLTPTLRPQHPRVTLPRLQNKASEMFCNYVSTGSGSALPIIILPRLIPIFLTPIPRLFVRWSTLEGVTSCGGLRSGTGFIAYGAQNGIALGFWGIGFSIFLPPVMAYGLFGYALFASVTAEEIELWPPNYPPEITVVSPLDGAKNVPVSTSELTFQTKDRNEGLMNYTVTTNPDVGSGSGNNILGGTYSVPISGLEGTEEYTWHIQVNDGVNVVEVSSSFTTEAVAPIVSDPKPKDGKRYVPLALSQLHFHLSDPQGDLMDYTVETSPDIGSDGGSGVDEGAYSVNVGGLDNLIDYTWYVNVTDGTNWKHKVFSFKTEPIMVFDPFDEGWLYRKNITIDHTKVAGDLTNFPVLVSTVDTDLRDKAQGDGDDILFMDGDGVATRLYHEIEHYDGSSGELVAWVNVTNLASGEDATLYMYYGNPSCCNQQTPEKVWDSNYVMVQHLEETSTGTRYDSTSNDNDGIPINYEGNEAVTGKIDGADDFDGIDDNIGLGVNTFNSYTGGTVSAWVKLDVLSGSEAQPIFAGSKTSVNDDYFTLQEVANGKLVGFVKSDDIISWKLETDNIVLSSDDWYYINIVQDNILPKIYVNNHEPSASFVELQDITQWFDDLQGTINWWIGHRHTDFHYCYCNGIIDEVRVSKIVRSFEWIKTEYNNQNDPSGFLSFGPEEP